MIAGLLTNPIVVLLAASIIVMSLMFLFVGRKKKPKKKIEKAIETKNESKSDDNEVEQNAKEEKSQKDDNFDKKITEIDKNFDKIDNIDSEDVKNSDKKVTKIYIRKPQNRSSNYEDNVSGESIYDNLSERAEFVKTSKTVSRFDGFKTQEQIDAEQQLIENALKEEVENCNVCKEVSTHFDHSRRILNSVKNNDFDNLFVSHLSEHYMNINAERHLSGRNEDIFKRAEELIQNGESRALDPESQEVYNGLKNDKDKLRFWFEQNRLNNQQSTSYENFVKNHDCVENNFSLKYLIMADALLKRKKKIKK